MVNANTNEKKKPFYHIIMPGDDDYEYDPNSPYQLCNKVIGQERNNNQFNKEYLDIMDIMCTDDEIKRCFSKTIDARNNDKIHPPSENDCLRQYDYFYRTAKKQIQNAADGSKIYRGLHIKDYKNFTDAITHRGFTLDEYVGKGKHKHRNAGIFWTWDKDCARLNGSCDEKPEKDLIILEGQSPSGINENGTLMANINNSPSEKEIRLLTGSKITITQICHFELKTKKKGVDLKEVCEPFNKRVIV